MVWVTLIAIPCFCVQNMTWGETTWKIMFVMKNNLFLVIAVSLPMGRAKRKECLQMCAKCADSDDPAHAQSLIRAFPLF